MMIRIGFWGTGSIANRVMADFRCGGSYSLTAVASRTLEKAEAFQRKHNVPLALEGMAALASREDVDLVYVASPHPFHAHDAEFFLNHGKHVIVEKPFTINDAQAAKLISLAREKKLFLMEAMWSRFLPAMQSLKQKVSEGVLGNVRLITANFGFHSAFDANSRIYNMDLGGGSLLDVGIYSLSFASLFLGPDASVQAVNAVKAPTGADESLAFQLSWNNGACAQLFSAVSVQTESRAMIYGDKGYAEIPDFWHAQKYSLTLGGKTEVYTFPPENEGHYHQFEHAAKIIESGGTESPLMPLSETEALMRLMTGMRKTLGIYYPKEKIHAEA